MSGTVPLHTLLLPSVCPPNSLQNVMLMLCASYLEEWLRKQVENV